MFGNAIPSAGPGATTIFGQQKSIFSNTQNTLFNQNPVTTTGEQDYADPSDDEGTGNGGDSPPTFMDAP